MVRKRLMVLAKNADSKLLTSWEIRVGRARLGSMLEREVNLLANVNQILNWVQPSMPPKPALKISILNCSGTTLGADGEGISADGVPRAGSNWLVEGSR